MHQTFQEIDTTCVVIGSGPAGYGTTIAALKERCPVLLVERHGFLGGMGTISGVSSYINYRHQGRDLSESVYRKLRKDIFAIGGGYQGSGEHVDFFDVEVSKQIMERTVLEFGGKLLYYSLLRSITREGDAWILRFACKGATVIVRAKFVIDATGDADACVLAGAKSTYGRNSDGKTQPMSMIVQLGGFDPKKWAESGGELIRGKYGCGGDCFSKEIAKAKAEGNWNIPRNNIAMWWSMPKDPSHVTINGSRLLGYSACNPFDMTSAEIEGRKQAQVLADFFRRYIPGFSESYLLSSGPQIGIRESRRIVGRSTLTERNIFKQEQPDDTVVRCAYPIDVHSPDDSETQFDKENGELLYGIPYGCLLPEGLENIAAAGRCISASHEAAGSFRVMPTCMALGEAAGVAVALAEQKGVGLSEIDPKEIRQHLDDALMTQKESHQLAQRVSA